MELNILSKNLTDTTYNKVSKYEVYNYFLTIVNLKSKLFTKRQIDVISCILAYDIDIRMRGSNREIAEKLEISKQQVSNIKSELVAKDYMDINGVFHSYFKNLKALINKNNKIDINLKLEL